MKMHEHHVPLFVLFVLALLTDRVKVGKLCSGIHKVRIPEPVASCNASYLIFIHCFSLFCLQIICMHLNSNYYISHYVNFDKYITEVGVYKCTDSLLVN